MILLMKYIQLSIIKQKIILKIQLYFSPWKRKSNKHYHHNKLLELFITHGKLRYKNKKSNHVILILFHIHSDKPFLLYINKNIFNHLLKIYYTIQITSYLMNLIY